MSTNTLNTLKGIFNGDFLVQDWFRKQYKLLIMIVCLLFFYIYFDFHAQRKHHELAQLQKELQDARFEYQTIHAEKVERTRQSAIYMQLQNEGSELKLNTTPVIRLR